MVHGRLPSSTHRRETTDAAHINALFHLECLDVYTPDRVRVVEDDPGLGLNVKLEVAAGAEVAPTNRLDLLYDLTEQVVIDQVTLPLQGDQDRVGAVQGHDFRDQRRIFWRTVKATKVHLGDGIHLEAVAIFSRDKLLDGEAFRVLEYSDHVRAAQVEELECLRLGQLLDEAGAVVLPVEGENYRLHGPRIQMRDELLQAVLHDRQDPRD